MRGLGILNNIGSPEYSKARYGNGLHYPGILLMKDLYLP